MSKEKSDDSWKNHQGAPGAGIFFRMSLIEQLVEHGSVTVTDYGKNPPEKTTHTLNTIKFTRKEMKKRGLKRNEYGNIYRPNSGI